MPELELEVKAAGSMPGRAYPVTGGIPFPKGELSVLDGVRLHDASGREAPVQTEVLATWDPAGAQVKWLLVDFQAVPESPRTAWTLAYGPDIRPAPPGPPVDPGASAWPPERILESLYMTDQSGRLYRAAYEKKERTVETETAGPLRTVVRAQTWHADEKGDRLCRAILRLHYYAGLGQVRVFHSFVMDPDPNEARLRSVGLKLPASGGGKVLVSGEQASGEVIEAGGPVALFQDDENHFEVSGGTTAEGRRNGTWLCAGGETGYTGVFLRNGWEEFPKRLVFDGAGVDVQLWPSERCPLFDLGGITEDVLSPVDEEELRAGLAKNPAAINMYIFLSRRATDWTYGTALTLIRRARELERELFPDRPAYYYGWNSFGKTGQGSMKTHELVLASLPGDLRHEEVDWLARTVRHPPVLVAPPARVCVSGVIGTQVPYGEAPFAEVDYAMTYGEFFDHREAVDRLHLYGDRNWGDYFNGTASQGPLAKVYEDDPDFRITDRVGWMNLESHDSAVGPWIQFLRTGDPRIFHMAEAHTEHIATVDHRHTFSPSGVHEAEIFYHGLRHYDTGLAPSHTLTNGILLGYCVTGDRGLREGALAAADHWIAEQGKAGTGWYAGGEGVFSKSVGAPKYTGVSYSRQNIAPLTCVLNAYLLTWDKKYIDSAHRFLNVWADGYDVTNPKHYLGGTLPYPGAEFLRQVDDPALEEVFGRIMRDVLTRMPIDGQGVYCMPGMAYLYEKTGDPTWAAYCQFAFEWHRSRLEQDGYSEWVRHNTFGLPAFCYGFVSGYAASGLALVARARADGVDMEAAMQRLREDRARAQGKDPKATDCLFYSVRLYTDRPLDWYRSGVETAPGT